jgi:beta-lactamase regulating signal transducer with metallopeptidase domain
MNPLELLLKGTAVAALAGAASFVLRRRSASQRHALWTTTTLALILLPLLLAFGLPWQIPVRTPQAPVPTTQQAFAPQVSAIGPIASSPTDAFVSPEAVRSFDWLGLLTDVWLAVAALLVFRQMLSLWAARRLVRSAAPFERASEQDGTRILVSDRISTPATVGCLRPVVLLPCLAREWSQERIEIVLAHEFAHIRRRDWLWINLSAFMSALNALNPLAWYVSDRLQFESELACDDAVLARGHDPQGYASELVAIARQVRGRQFEPALLGMARRFGLKDRIRALADPRRRRAQASPISSFGTFLAITATVLAVGACKVAAQMSTARPPTPIAGVAIPPGVPWKGDLIVRVLDEARNPVPKARVAVAFSTGFMFGFGVEKQQMVTGSDGICKVSDKQFETGTANGSPAEVAVHADGYAMSVSVVQPDSRETRCVLGRGSSVTIRFRDPAGTPVQGVQATVRGLIPRGETQCDLWLPVDPKFSGLTETSDGTGQAVLRDLPAGCRVVFETRHPRFVSLTCYDSSLNGNRLYAQPVPVQDAPSEVVLTPAGTISGRVSTEGRPLAGVRVQANLVGRNGGVTATSDSNGQYRIVGLRPDAYSVRIWNPPHGLTCIAYESVSVNSAETNGIDFEMKSGAVIQGRVRYADGTIPDRLLQFKLTGPAFPESAGGWIVDEKGGTFEARVWPGTYTITLPNNGVMDSDAAPPLFSQQVDVPDGRTTNVDVVLPTPNGPAPARGTSSAFASGEGRFYGPATLSDGHKARLAFVQADGIKPWQPDGSPASAGDNLRALDFNTNGTTRSSRAIFARIDIDEPRENLDCIVSVPHRSEWTCWQTYGANGKSLDMATFRVPGTLKTTDLRIGIGHGPFKLVISEPFGGPVLQAKTTDRAGIVLLTVPVRYRQEDAEVFAIDEAGQEHRPCASPSQPLSAQEEPLQYYFCNVGTDQIRKLELRIRPWDWVTFTGIRLWPG